MVDLAGLHLGPHRTVGLGVVHTVGEPTVGRPLLEVAKYPADGLLGQGEWNMTVAFLGAVVALSVITAVLNKPPEATGGAVLSGSTVDTYTSDGRALHIANRPPRK